MGSEVTKEESWTENGRHYKVTESNRPKMGYIGAAVGSGATLGATYLGSKLTSGGNSQSSSSGGGGYNDNIFKRN
jgi:hypothetical protein